MHQICILGWMVPAPRASHNPRGGGSMSKIRVLIRDTPTMLRDILEQAIANQPDIEMIRQTTNRCRQMSWWWT
jgi:hypothetical protein